jgi:hypothetical protein
MALHVGHNCNPWDGCDVCGAKVEPPYRQRTDVCAVCRQGFTLCRCRHQLREWKEKQAMRDKLEDAFARLRVAFEADDYTPMEDVIEAVLQRFTGDLHLVSENSRLRAENERLHGLEAAVKEATEVMASIYEDKKAGRPLDDATVDIGIGCWLENYALSKVDE